MGDRTSTLTFLAKDAASGPIKGINKALDHMGTSAKNAGKHIGAAAVNVAKIGTAAVAGGVLALGAGLAYAAKQAAEEEKGIARLDAALKANVPAWNGNTDAINRAIAAGERKAFSDDDQREAISRLITSTKNVAEATKLNALAMDFARLKGIPLADAANIIGKVHDGNVGILSRYGITVAKGATATEALAQIQAAAAGQADAYGKTTAGAWESVQLAVGNVVEDVGAALLPVLSQVAGYLSDNLIPMLQEAGAQFGRWVEANKPLIEQIGTFVSTTLTNLVTFVVAEVVPRLAAIGEKLAEVGGVIVNDVAPVIVDFWKRVWEGGLNKAVDAAARVIQSVIDVLIEFVGWITANETIMEGFRVLASLIGAAFGFIADAVTTVLDWLGDFGDWITNNEPLMAALDAAVRGIGVAFQTAQRLVGDFMRGLQTLVQWARDNLDILNFLFGGSEARPGGQYVRPPGGVPGAATGGWVGLRGPEMRLVGERGPEYITPNNQLRGPGGLTLAAGAIVVNGAGDPEAVARSVMQALKRETQRQGMTF